MGKYMHSISQAMAGRLTYLGTGQPARERTAW